VHRTGELLKKIWHPKQFKGQVSPHEFLQIVMKESLKKYSIEKQGDPMFFFAWIATALHKALTNSNKKDSVISQTFFGELEVWTEKVCGSRDVKMACGKVERLPFFILGLDLPPTPLFKDAFERMPIPQVPLYQLLKKYME